MDQNKGQNPEQELEQEEGPYIFQHVVKKANLTYQMPDYLHFSMESAGSLVETMWGKPFHKIPLKELFEKARKGDPICNLFLAYLYLDKRLETQYGEKYNPSFSERKLTDEEMENIQVFLKEKRQPYEWNFIEGWLAFFSLLNFSSVSKKMGAVKESSEKFLKAREGEFGEFEFQWAFFVVDMDPFFNFEDSHVWEARHIILTRAQEGYAPAQYLQSVIEWNNDNPSRTIQWLQKAHDQNFRRNFSTAVMGLIFIGEGDYAKAMPYLKSAVYEHDMEFLKPELLSAYLKLSQVPSAFQVAKEIGENYTRFPPETSIYAIGFLITALANGLGTEQNFEGAYVWVERLPYIAAENQNAVDFNEEFMVYLKKQLSPKQIEEAERRAKILYRPAKLYSEMDETNTCSQFFH